MAETTKLGERLIEAGLITQEALHQALELQSRAGGRLGDCLVELRLISEQALLRFLAAQYGTRYVAAEKLAKLKVPTEVLDKVPVRMAEKTGLVPIALDAERKILSVVMAEPQNTEVIEELKVVAGVEEVVSYIALRSSVIAGIKKLYYGDPSAFAMLEQADAHKDVRGMAAFYEHGRADTRALHTSELNLDASRSQSVAAMALAGQSISEASTGKQPSSVRRALDHIQHASVASDNDFIETLNILVGLLELHGNLKGHSARVAKQVRTVAQRLGLSQREVNHATIAAYLHELGKSEGHATLLSCAMDAERAALAKKFLRTPLKLFETVHLPSQVNAVLAQLFEAYDGTGQPQGVKGEDIATGARILAVVDSFEDLVSNPANPLARLLGKDEALRRIADQAGKLFDSAVVELLRQIHTGEILRQRILAEGHQVLLAEPDEPVRMGLTRALSQLGLTLAAVTSSELALQHAVVGEADLVIASIDLRPDDAFVLAAELKQEPLTASIPVILLAERDEPKLRERAAQLGVAEVLLKPIDEEQLAASCKALLDRRIAAGAPHRTVSGSLEELGLPELLRILAAGKRSGQLLVRTPSARGEIYLERGRVVHAVCGQAKGREAAEQILTWTRGDFRLDPNFLVLEQQMDADPEILLRDVGGRAARPSHLPADDT